VVVDLSEELTIKAAEVVQVVNLTQEQDPPKTLKFFEPIGLPALPPPSSYPPFPWPRTQMAALPPPIAYHDRAYNAIQFPADFDDPFADTLAAICKVTVNTCCYLYATGIHSMATMVEFFPTHDDIYKFINGVSKKEGKELTLPLYRDLNFLNQDVILRFPLVQQVRLKALRLYAVSHAYCGLLYNIATLDEATILRFGLFVTTINSGKTTKDMPETGIPVLPALGNAAENYLVWSDKMTDFLSNYCSCYTGAPLNYLIRDDETGKVASSATYETLDQFLIESMQLNPAINLHLSKKINYWQRSLGVPLERVTPTQLTFCSSLERGRVKQLGRS
jgi:hypothetical protein